MGLFKVPSILMRTFLPSVLSLALASTLFAESSATFLTTPGAVLAEEHFDQPKISEPWSVTKGTWQILDGALEGREKAEDKHPGVCSLKVVLPASFVVNASLRFEGASMTTMVFNGAGHICRVTVTPAGFSVAAEKEKDSPTDKTVNLGKVAQEFIPGQWYNFTIEITGDEMLVYTDLKHVAYGRDAKVARAKSAFNVTVYGSSVRYDNIVIRAAERNSDWPTRKSKLGLK